MLISEYVEVSWQRRNIRHYKSKGYTYTGLGDMFTVSVRDLTEGSHVKIESQCDFCGDVVEKPYKAYLSQTKNETEADACVSCAFNKAQKSNLENYGVINPMQVDKFKKKLMNTLYENGTAPSSSQQNHIHSIIGGELNYPQDSIMLDIAFPDESVYLEYDGSGHDLQVKFGALTQDEFNEKEKRRSFFLKRKGWKEMRIVCDNDKLPNDNMIKDFVDKTRSFFNAEKSTYITWNTITETVEISNRIKISTREYLDDDFTLPDKEVA